MAEEITSATGTQLKPLTELLMHDVTLQISLAILIVGIFAIVLLSKKTSTWIDSKKFSYSRPYAAEFVKKIMLSLFAVALVLSISTYIQVFELFDTQIAIDAANANEELTPR